MPGTKKTPGPVKTKENRAVRQVVRQNRQMTPKPRSRSGSVEPVDVAPHLPSAEQRQITVEDRRTLVQAQLLTLPADDMDDFPIGLPDLTKDARRYHGDIGKKKDEIAAEYDVYINTPTMKVMILQYPNRDPGQPYSEKNGQKPLEFRIKPKCGLIEVDIPMDVHTNFDKGKGVIYGEAMRRSRVLQEGGSYGMAGGFGIGSKPRPTASDRQQSTIEEPTHESLLASFDDANNKGHVMNKITLGGQIVPFKEGNDPNYFIGVFKGKNLYLNKVDAIVQLRPQFAHLDALIDFEKPARALRTTENGEEESEAKAVNMSVKSTEVEETDMYGGENETSKLLKAMREEPWQRKSWIDQDDPRAYDTYEEQFFISPHQTVPDLISTMTHEEWLDAMSAPRVIPGNPGPRHMSLPGRNNDPTDSEDSEDETDKEDEDGSEWETDGEEGAHSGEEEEEEEEET